MPRLIFVGDSLTFGIGATNSSYSYPSQLISHVSAVPLWNSSNLGGSGATVADITALYASQVLPLRDPSNPRQVVVFWAGTNGLGGVGSGATIYSQIAAYCANAQADGFLVTVATIINRTSVDPAFEAERTILNDSLRLNWATFADVLIDLAADARLEDFNDLVYFTADKVHLNDEGYNVVQSLVSAGIDILEAS